MASSIASGIAVGLFGFFFAGKFLSLMGTPDDVLPLAALYLKIYFLGAPGSLVFNFGASILRATGDTKRPLIILSLTGLVNVVLNLILVVVFHLNVAGVAIATIVAQYLSAIFIVIRLLNLENACRLKIKNIRIHKAEVKDIIKIGLPAGLQNSLFSLSNVLIQSTINTFGSAVMAGNTAGSNFDSYVYTCTNAVAQTTMNFTSQNMGAKKYKNLNKVYFICLGLAFGISVAMGTLGLLFPEQIIGIFSTDQEVITWGVQRLYILMSTYFLCSLMDVSGCQIRGMGRSLEPMIITLIGACGIRIMWLYTGFKFNPQLWNLYLSYPISWALTFISLFVCYLVFMKRLKKSQ